MTRRDTCLASRLFAAAALAVVLALAAPAAVSAKDLGVRGATWPVAEPDLLEQIESRLLEMQRSGELERLETQARANARRKLEEPDPAPGIAPARERRSRLWDPAITVARDIRTPDGTLIAAAGMRVNPLERMTLVRDLLFVDGRREAEIAWALDAGIREWAPREDRAARRAAPRPRCRTSSPALLLRPGRPSRGPVRAASSRPRVVEQAGSPCSALQRSRSRTGRTPDRCPGQACKPHEED